MILHRGVDAAFPGAPLPEGTDILAAYIGVSGQSGSPDTPHIWTPDDWNGYVNEQPNLRLLPIYVHSFPGDPVADAANAVNAALALGWEPHAGRLIACDFEMLIDPGYVASLGSEMVRLGFRAAVYGSVSVIFDNPVLSGRWVSQLLTRPPAQLPYGVIGQQWKFGESWDYDVFDQFTYDNCGQGLRRG